MNLLLVDDDQPFRQRLARCFEEEMSKIYQADDVRCALRILDSGEIVALSVAIVDLRMPGVSSLDLIPRLRSQFPASRILVLTGYGSIATATEAIKRGADEYLTKPMNKEELVAAVHGRKILHPATLPTLDQVTDEYMNRVLTSVGGNITKAAKLLGLHRRSLQRKLGKAP